MDRNRLVAAAAHRPSRRLAAFLLGLGYVASAGALSAAIVTVDIVGDENDPACTPTDCSLREAIAAANSGDTIEFAPALAGGTITPSLGQLVIAKNLTIDAAALDITIQNGSVRHLKISGAATTVTIAGLTFRDAPANPSGDRHGGTIYNEGDLTILDCVFRDSLTYGVPDNTVSADGGDGGTIYNAAGAKLRLERVVIRDSATGDGGFFVSPDRYHGGRGGAIYNAGTLEIVDTTLRTSSTGRGRCAMSDGGDGGLIYNAGTGVATITGSTLETGLTGEGGGPSSPTGCPPFGSPGLDGRGGGIYNAGNLAINNSTLTANSTATGAAGTAQPGGGIYNGPGGTLRLRNVTIAENVAAGSSGGGIYRANGTSGNNSTVLVKNSLIAGNLANGGTQEDCGNAGGSFGAMTSEGFNLVGIADGCTAAFTVNDLTGTAAMPLDPLFDPAGIGANGGPTDTYLLQTTSPAVDAANPDDNECDAYDAATGTETPFTVDQRGLPRPTDGDGILGARCDIGAVELPAVATADVAVSKDDGLTAAYPGQAVTYTIVASNAGPDPVAGATIADLFPAVLPDCSWTCVGAGGATCTAGPVADDIEDTIALPVGGTATYTVGCTIDASATGTVANTVTITAPGVPDPTPANNTATDSDDLLIDYGDAPDTYDTTLAAGGPRHPLATIVALGAGADSEPDGTPSPNADGDVDDGVQLPATPTRGVVNSFTVTATTTCLLDAFFDWNVDGDFADPGEQAATGVALATGANQVDLAIPGTVPAGAVTFARFRVSTAGGLGPGGPALDGEVEDYRLSFRIFDDGFESGTVGNWSTAVGN